MVRNFGVGENEVAKWVGFTSAIFSISQCMTAVPWGTLSDRVGRKPIILTGLLITMIFSLVFGFSNSLPMAITARACMGLGNGNVGIMRTIVAELVPERELQPRAFSLMPLVWNIGTIFGPAFGGALADPAKKHPQLFGKIKLFELYPYALPNIIVSVLFITGVLIGFLFLRVCIALGVSSHCLLSKVSGRRKANEQQETNESRKDQHDYGLVLGNILLKPCISKRRQKQDANARLTEDDDERRPLLQEGTVSSSNGNDPTQVNDRGSLSWAQILTPQTNLALLAYASLALHTLAFDSLTPVFLSHPKQELDNNPAVKLPFKFSGGFGMGMHIRMKYHLVRIIHILTLYLLQFQRPAKYRSSLHSKRHYWHANSIFDIPHRCPTLRCSRLSKSNLSNFPIHLSPYTFYGPLSLGNNTPDSHFHPDVH